MLTDQEIEILKKSDIIINPGTSTANWEIDVEGDIGGRYLGTFTFRCYLTPMQQISAGREYREILGTNPSLASEHDGFLAFSLTQLKYRILTAPPFWNSSNSSYGGNLPDESVLSIVLDAALSAEMKYKATLKQKKLEAINRAKAALQKEMEQEKEEKEESED